MEVDDALAIADKPTSEVPGRAAMLFTSRARQRGATSRLVRLGDGLTVADWQWPIGIGQLPLGSRYEGMPRYAAHGLKHAGIERRRHRAAAVLARDHLDRANHVASGSCVRVSSCRLRGAGEQQRSDRGHQRPQKTLFRPEPMAFARLSALTLSVQRPGFRTTPTADRLPSRPIFRVPTRRSLTVRPRC